MVQPNNFQINESTPLAMLTLGQLRDALQELNTNTAKHDEPASTGKRYVYGLRGIQDLFQVSHKTAQIYKDGMLKPAVYQTGKKIIVDADMAMQIFKTGRAEL